MLAACAFGGRLQRLLVQSAQQRLFVEVLDLRRRRAWRSWRHVLTLVRFIGIVKRWTRNNSLAEVIKEFIEASWRGFQVRASTKLFFFQVRVLQRTFRDVSKRRMRVRELVLRPAIWEIETQLLGKFIGLPEASLKAELDNHRASVEEKRRADVPTTNTDAVRWFRREKDRQLAAFASDHAAAMSQTFARRSRATVTNSSRPTPRGVNYAALGHPKMNVIQSYRLPEDVLRPIINAHIRASVERWWKRYNEYSELRSEFDSSWSKWRKTVVALGQSQRERWPPHPQIPRYPYELFRLDRPWLQRTVHAALKQADLRPS